MSVGVVLVAAGQGTRLGAGLPKALVPLRGTPIVTHALRGVLSCPDLTDVVVVGPPDGMPELARALEVPVGGTAHEVSGVRLRLVPGGARRADSVAAGLAALPASVDTVLVHDAARALTPPQVVASVAASVRAGHDAVVPGLPVTDTVKQVRPTDEASEQVVWTPERSSLRAIQTPQGFARETLEQVHGGDNSSGADATDDATLVEQGGGLVTVVPGHPLARKITGPEDLAWAESVLAARERAASADAGPLGRGPATAPVLFVLAGLPGVGKTAVAREIAARRRAAHVRVDTIETALLRDERPRDASYPGPLGYSVAYDVAADQLRHGLDVVADAVNPVAVTRHTWGRVARDTGARLVQVELGCDDAQTHRGRVEAREPDLTGHQLPGWADVVGRHYEPWTDDGVLHLDTARLTVAALAERIEAAVPQEVNR